MGSSMSLLHYLFKALYFYLDVRYTGPILGTDSRVAESAPAGHFLKKIYVTRVVFVCCLRCCWFVLLVTVLTSQR